MPQLAGSNPESTSFSKNVRKRSIMLLYMADLCERCRENPIAQDVYKTLLASVEFFDFLSAKAETDEEKQKWLDQARGAFELSLKAMPLQTDCMRLICPYKKK
jgi:carboxypeptidase C (cathepsin A)